jgi:glycosyltransferase involved in cell wall biosynthesis
VVEKRDICLMGCAMQKPIVSVVLGSYNRLPFLRLALESIRQELNGVTHEIIVVEGGSDDGALEWLTQQKDVITIVQHNRGHWSNKPIERRSWGYFMNLGFKIAQGTYICMLSDDCLAIPGAIQKGVALFDDLLMSGHHVGALAFYWRDWSKSTTYHVGYTLGDKLYVNHGMFLRSALQAIDYIDEENFFFYNADGDVCLKLWHHGYEILESPDSYIEHYPHANVDVRSTNYVRFKNDLENYLSKWEGIFYDRKRNNCGHIQERRFDDVAKTSELFVPLHQEIVQKNPHLAKQSPAWMQHWNHMASKIHSLLRRV